MDLQAQREFQDGELIPGTRFRVVRMIGQGGAGHVYEVVHVELEKRFVLKALSHELVERPDLVARLKSEWKALRQLEHPNIANVTDAGTTEHGIPFYAMPWLDGETLAMHMRQSTRLELGRALEIALGVLEGLSAAHQIGIVHRDVKPSNLFLVAGGGVRLLDFGVEKPRAATIRDPGLAFISSRGLAIGRSRYLSPEQARGEHVDGRADLYATGFILFEMVSGQGPFEGLREPDEAWLLHMHRPPPRLGQKVSHIPPTLDHLMASLLAIDPRDRPATARAAADSLRSIAQSLGGTNAAESSSQYAAEAHPSATVAVVNPVAPGQSTLLRFSATSVLTQPPSAQASPTTPQPGTSWAAQAATTRLLRGEADSTEMDVKVQAPGETSPLAPTVLGLGHAPLAVGPLAAAATNTSPLGGHEVVSPLSAGMRPAASLHPEPTLRLEELDSPDPRVVTRAAGDLADTRTQIPLAEALVPGSTPPPLIPMMMTGTRGNRPGRAVLPAARWVWLVAVAVVSCLLAVIAILVLRAWSGSRDRGLSVTLSASQALVLVSTMSTPTSSSPSWSASACKAERAESSARAAEQAHRREP
jgi:serine/threonine protein kinase